MLTEWDVKLKRNTVDVSLAKPVFDVFSIVYKVIQASTALTRFQNNQQL